MTAYPWVIKQPNTWSCMACVAAMITGETLEDVVQFIGHDGSAQVPLAENNHPENRRGFTWGEIFGYLVSRDKYLGFYLQFAEPVDGECFQEVKKMPVDVYLSWPAAISVTSERLPGCTHFVYWDGTNIYDPNPLVEGPQPLSRYRIIDWWPIMALKEATNGR